MKLRALAPAMVLLAALLPSAVSAAVVALDTVKGATVWFVEDHSLPMLAVEVSLPAGSAYDPAGKSGLADFAGSMVDEGAGNLDSKAFHEALANRAIELTVTTDRDTLDLTLTTLSENAPDAFRLLGLALQHPRFDGDAAARVRAQLLQNLESDSEDPEQVAQRGLLAAYFAGHPYAGAPSGDAQGIDAVTVNDLRNFARAHWVRGGLKIVIVGDVTNQAIVPLLQAAFGKLSGSTPPPPPPVTHTGKAGAQTIAMDVSQPAIAFGLPAVPRASPDYIAAFVCNQILGGSFSSRLGEEVRVRHGLTYGISTELLSYRRASLVLGEWGSRREAVARSIGLVRATIAKFASDGPTDEELADAKRYLTGSFPLAFASDAEMADQLAEFQREGLAPDYVAKRNGLINAVTIDDVRRVAKRLFDPARLTIVVAGADGDAHAQATPGH